MLKNRIKYITSSHSIRLNESLFIATTMQCNLKCSYCMVISNTGDSTLSNKKITSIFIEYCELKLKHGFTECNIIFGGGEPLLNWELVKKIITISKSFTNLMINFAIETNGLLVTPDIAKVLLQENFTISISIDGFGVHNNIVRNTKSKNINSFKKIDSVLIMLRDIGISNINISTTLSQANFDFPEKEFIFYLSQYFCKSLTIELDRVHPINQSPEAIVEKLKKLQEIGIEQNILVSGNWTLPYFRKSRRIPTWRSGCSATDGSKISVSPSGDLNTCIYFHDNLKKSESIEAFMESNAYKNHLKFWKRGSIKPCKNCPIEYYCAGGCAITTLSKNLLLIQERCRVYQLITEALWRQTS